MLSWLIGLSLMSLLVGWSEPVSWAPVDVTPLADIAGIDEALLNPVLAPDGSAFAWDARDAACIYRFADEATFCYDWPEGTSLRPRRSNLPAWSPDSRYIAYTENFFEFLYDSDIWLLDTHSGAWTNRTDDGYYGSPVVDQNATDHVLLDYLPTWNPATGELYFFRSQRRDRVLFDIDYTLQLYKMPADSGEPELVRDLTLAVPGPLSVERTVAFSQDGTKLALLALPRQSVLESPGAGVWVLDFANNGTHLAVPLRRLIGILPDWAEPIILPDAVQWAGDNLVIWLVNDYLSGVIKRTPVHVDMATGDITPLVDFSDFTSAADHANARSEQRTVHDEAIIGTVLRDESAYWLVVANGEEEPMGVFELPLPGTDAEPRQVATIPYQMSPRHMALPSMSDDGKLLMLHTLFTLREAQPDS